MPCSLAQATCTAPVAGAGKVNTYGPARLPETLVAGLPLIHRSDAFTRPPVR